jgi:ATP-dependent Clp protease adapter protein ClpS
MRILWFGRSRANDGGYERISARAQAVPAVSAAQPRGDDQISLALGSLPRYRVLLRLRPQDAATADAWESVLAPALGRERAARVIASVARDGVGLITTCPRELAEYYRDALISRALPCAIEPA